MSQQSGLKLYTVGTPNGHKASIFLEELKASGAIPGYEFQALSFQKNEQKEDWFLKINPNGRIPALIDGNRNNQRVFESASILFYLAKHYDAKGEFTFKDDDSAETEMISWIFFGHGGVGPMQGQANHFMRYAPEDVPYGKKRYVDETKRLYMTMDKHLAGREYFAGSGKGKYSIADISIAPWVRSHEWAHVSLDEYPNLNAWLERLEARPAFQAGVNVPTPDRLTELKKNPELAEKAAKEASAWIMKGQQSK